MPVDDAIEQRFPSSDPLGDNRDAEVADLFEQNLSDELVSRAREYGVVFAIDADSHAVPHLDYIRYGVAVAQRGWVPADEVINA